MLKFASVRNPWDALFHFFTEKEGVQDQQNNFDQMKIIMPVIHVSIPRFIEIRLIDM